MASSGCHGPKAARNVTDDTLCSRARDAFEGVSTPQKPTQGAGGLIPNVPVTDPCSSIFELLYERELYTAAAVLRRGLGRTSSMLFDPFTAITVLAPTDEAFAEFNITEDGDSSQASIDEIAERHVLPGVYTSKDIACSRRGGSESLKTQTWSGDEIVLRLDDQARLQDVANANLRRKLGVRTPDLPACLSILHVLDGVMWLGSMKDVNG